MKIYKIMCCENCPKLGFSFTIDGLQGYKMCYMNYSKKIEDTFTLPKWCPLEDYNANNHQ